jgi:methionyl-tRNA formyltransferase
MQNYVVATVKDWNIKAFEKYTSHLKGNWYLINTSDELTIEFLEEIKPRYIFFPHWSWIVPEKIIEKFECVCFHMTDVPYGRGGSPLQNLIIRGHKSTKLSALRMEAKLDAGPVYGKLDLMLDGSAQDIYEATAELVYQLVEKIIVDEPEPIVQRGDVVIFERRTPEQSRIPETYQLEELFDHIRMLDAQSYPHAFIDYGDFRLEFTNAKFRDDEIDCQVRIRKVIDAND